MNSIPWTFIRERTRLSWREAALGYRNQWISGSDVVHMACDYVLEGEAEAAVIELAGLSEAEEHLVGELLENLAKLVENHNEVTAKDKWLFLRLAWLFENRATLNDPLKEVDKIYADFDYPEDVASFVRYMPVTDGYEPSKHSSEENCTRLISNWRSYINSKAAIFATHKPKAFEG